VTLPETSAAVSVTALTEVDLKGLVAEAVAATLALRTSQGRWKRPRLGQSMVKPTPCQTNRFSVLEASTVGLQKIC